MQFILLLFLYLLFPLSAYAIEDDDFWLMLDNELPKSNLSINAGQDNEDGTFYGGYLDLAVTDDFYLKLSNSVSRQKLATETSQWSLGFGNNPQNYFLWNINYERWGNSSVLETSNIIADLNMYGDNWNGLIKMETGKVTLQGLSLSTDIEHRSLGLGFGYNNQHLYWSFSHQRHNYAKDLSKLNFSPILFILKPILLRIITPGSQQQATALADNETIFRIGWGENKYTTEAAYQWIESAVTNEVSEFARLNISRQITASINLGVELGHIIGGPTSAAVILDYAW